MELVLISDGRKYEIKGIKYTKKRNIKFVVYRNNHKEELAAGRFREPVDYTKEEITSIPGTYELTSSSDHQDRLVGEYIETCIRFKKLKEMLIQYRAGKLSFTPNCSYELLAEQLDILQKYIMILEKRFVEEGIKHVAGYYDEYDTEDFKIPF